MGHINARSIANIQLQYVKDDVNKLKVAHLNIRSIRNKITHVRKLVTKENFDILAVSETWLTPEDSNNMLKIEGYNLARIDRTHSRGGGLLIYSKAALKGKILNVITGIEEGIEQLWIHCTYKGRGIAIGVIYRPSIQTSLEKVENSLADISTTYDYIICMGDLNNDMLQRNRNTEDLITMLDIFDLKQIITHPTRITADTESLIDILCVNKNWNVIESGTKDTSYLSDHDMVYAFLEFEHEEILQQKFCRNFNNIEMDKFDEDAKKMNWGRVYQLENIDDKVKWLNSCVLSLIDFHAPLVPISKKKLKAPWMTYNLKCILKARDNAHRKYKRTRTEADRRYYCQIRNYTNRAVNIEKKKYYEHTIKQNINNSKVFWNKMRWWGFVNNNKSNSIATSENFNPNEINEHFINCTSHITSEVKLYNYYYDNHTTEHEDFTIEPIDPKQISKIVHSIKSNAPGMNGITVHMIKMCLQYCNNELSHIINCSLQKGEVPTSWKSAKVIPLLKKEDSSELKDLRPISILPPESKVLEKIVHEHLTEYLEKHNMFLNAQSGFRKHRSTTTALLKIHDDIITATDNNMITVLVLLDMSKAFDSVNHELLLSKLYFIGIRGIMWEWFRSYLTERQQTVQLSGKDTQVLSTQCTIKSGVPQGSILGPLLFNVFVIDLEHKINSCSVHYYADDIQVMLSCRVSECHEAFQKISEDLNSILQWTRDNGLQININKTDAIIFGSEKNRNELRISDPKLTMDNNNINFNDHVKNLGLIMDEKLNFTKQVSSMCRSAYASLRSLYHLRNHLPKDAKVKLSDSLVLSKINYCDIVYGPSLTVENTHKIQKVQNACIRFAQYVPYREHISPYIKQVGWLNMKQRRWVHLCCMVHNVIAMKKPEYLLNKIEIREHAHSVATRNRDVILTVPVHHTENFKKSFSYQATKIYNQLPANLKRLSPNSFKINIIKLIKSEQFTIDY